MNEQAPASTLPMLSVEQSERLRRRRRAQDWLARAGIMLGGVGVIAAVATIFLYLVYEVAPLFADPEVAPTATYALPGDGAGKRSLALALEEQNEVGFRLDAGGELADEGLDEGVVLHVQVLRLGEDAEEPRLLVHLEELEVLRLPQHPLEAPH